MKANRILPALLSILLATSAAFAANPADDNAPASLSSSNLNKLDSLLKDKSDETRLAAIDEMGNRGAAAQYSVPKLTKRLEDITKELPSLMHSSHSKAGMNNAKEAPVIDKDALKKVLNKEALHIVEAVEKIAPSDALKFYEFALTLDHLPSDACDKIIEGVKKLPQKDALALLDRAFHKSRWWNGMPYLTVSVDRALRSLGPEGNQMADKFEKQSQHLPVRAIGGI